MKLFIDENVSRRIAERLALDGHSVFLGQHIAHGKQDDDVLDTAR
jgi:predicted nuclease of predicted toxin-antitoxin system